MRVLLSTIGSRGDVQPLVALAQQLIALDQEVHLCVPPDFQNWIESLGMTVTPIGPELRSTGKAGPPMAPPTPEQRRQMAEALVISQFEKIFLAAQGCNVIVGATALQIAAPSVAEKMGIPYVFVAYCPAVLPSPHHAPPVLSLLEDAPAPTPADYARLTDKRPPAYPPARGNCPGPIHRHHCAHRWRSGRRSALDRRGIELKIHD